VTCKGGRPKAAIRSRWRIRSGFWSVFNARSSYSSLLRPSVPNRGKASRRLGESGLRREDGWRHSPAEPWIRSCAQSPLSVPAALAACSARFSDGSLGVTRCKGSRQGMRCTGSRSGRPSLPVPQCLGRCRRVSVTGKSRIETPDRGQYPLRKGGRSPASCRQADRPRAAQGLSHPRVSLGIHQVPLLGPIGRVRQAAIHRVAPSMVSTEPVM